MTRSASHQKPIKQEDATVGVSPHAISDLGSPPAGRGSKVAAARY